MKGLHQPSGDVYDATFDGGGADVDANDSCVIGGRVGPV
jgi:hypothetical protein